MREITAVFIDDGGVMNDNSLRGPQWQRLVAEFFVPILGGEHAAWAEANRVVFQRLWDEFILVGPQGRDYTEWWDECQRIWLCEMAAFVGVQAPSDDAQCVKLAQQAAVCITQRVRSAYPGAVEAIRAIHEMGVSLFTASGGHSRELDGYLTGMGARGFFRTLYGPDLVNQAKEGVEYYRRVFTHAGIDPKRALVVDDSPSAVAWARIAGAVTCLVTAVTPQDIPADLIVPRLADLPAIIGG
jgi:HAD superfamily hydrolase (TIGR01509 family)